MSIFLIRHTKVNLPAGVCYGFSEVTPAGSFIDEANLIKQKLKDFNFNKIISSPLLRCKLLAEYIFDNQAIIYDDRLKEMDFGLWELKNWDDIFSSQIGKAWFDDYINTKAPEGESYKDLYNRVNNFVTYYELINNRNCDIALVTHSGVIRAILSLLLQIPDNEIFTKLKIEFGDIISISDNNFKYL